METGRIFFFGNPWPAGHPIKEFAWTCRRHEGRIFFDFHLETEDYDLEAEVPDEPDIQYESDWVAPGVWNNFHQCILSSTHWHQGGFQAGDLSEIDLGKIDGLEVVIDDPPPIDKEDSAFFVYLLGHDSVAQHRVKFRRVEDSDTFDIEWTGRVALTYVGDYEYRYTFSASIRGARVPSLSDA